MAKTKTTKIKLDRSTRTTVLINDAEAAFLKQYACGYCLTETNFPLDAKELRLIADKLDELNGGEK